MVVQAPQWVQGKALMGNQEAKTQKLWKLQEALYFSQLEENLLSPQMKNFLTL